MSKLDLIASMNASVEIRIALHNTERRAFMGYLVLTDKFLR